MTDEIFEPKTVMHVLPCHTPGLSCCRYKLVGCKPAKNVQRCEVWCTKWRLQRDREHVIRGCHPDYPKSELESNRCANCDGKGKVTTYLDSPFFKGGTPVVVECPKCKGMGTV